MEYFLTLGGQSLFSRRDPDVSKYPYLVYYVGTETDGKITSCVEHRAPDCFDSFAKSKEFPLDFPPAIEPVPAPRLKEREMTSEEWRILGCQTDYDDEVIT